MELILDKSLFYIDRFRGLEINDSDSKIGSVILACLERDLRFSEVQCRCKVSIRMPRLGEVSKILKQSEQAVYSYLMSTDVNFRMDNYFNKEDSNSDIFLTRKSVERLKEKNRSLLQDWFDNSLMNFSRLSGEDRKAFDDFIVEFSKTGKQVNDWKDIDLLKIDEAFFREVYEYESDTAALTLERRSVGQRTLDNVRNSSFYNSPQISPRSGLFRHIFLRYAIEVFLTHRYHIFSSEDSDSSYLVLQ